MIFILTGNIETGKSNALMHWIEGRTNVFGVLSPRNKENKRYFLDVSTKETFVMEANPKDEENIISVGRYHFLKSAFKKANAIITNAVNKNESGFILIDELGKLEMRSEGLYESARLAIEKTMHNTNLHVILVVRKGLLDMIIKKYSIANAKTISNEQLTEAHIDNVTLVTNEDFRKP